jgi:AraC family transcriptional regulator, transcriptional activator of the genes for pyochelin and ferripyochelin receptors
MSHFELLSPDGEDILLGPLEGRPNKKDLIRAPLAGAVGFGATCSFGDMAFYYYQGEGFTIWKSHYDIRRRARVIGRADQAILELSSMYEGRLDVDWREVVSGKLKLKQVQLNYAPYVDNTTVIEGGKQYLTLDVHFSPTLLESYVKDAPVLGRFLEQVAKGQASMLFDRPVHATAAVNQVLKSIMQFSLLDELAPRYYGYYVHILLMHVLDQATGLKAPVFRPTPDDVEKAHEARRLLLSDYSRSYKIDELCRLVGTNPNTLKRTFKQEFGSPIGHYKRTAFMDHAKILLLETPHTIDEIAMLIGYQSQQGFTSAYKGYWGCTPGWERRGR